MLMAAIFLVTAIKVNAQFAIAVCEPLYGANWHWFAYKDFNSSQSEVKTYAMEHCITGNNGERPFILMTDEDSHDKYMVICTCRSQYGTTIKVGVGIANEKDAAKENAMESCIGYEKKIVKVFAPYLISEYSGN